MNRTCSQGSAVKFQFCQTLNTASYLTQHLINRRQTHSCSCCFFSMPDDWELGLDLKALGASDGRGAGFGPGLPQPAQPLEGEPHRGCKIPLGRYISPMKYGCRPCVSLCLPVHVSQWKVNWRAWLILLQQTWRCSRPGKVAAEVSLNMATYMSIYLTAWKSIIIFAQRSVTMALNGHY